MAVSGREKVNGALQTDGGDIHGKPQPGLFEVLRQELKLRNSPREIDFYDTVLRGVNADVLLRLCFAVVERRQFLYWLFCELATETKRTPGWICKINCEPTAPRTGILGRLSESNRRDEP